MLAVISDFFFLLPSAVAANTHNGEETNKA